MHVAFGGVCLGMVSARGMVAIMNTLCNEMKVAEELGALGVTEEAAERILSSMAARSLDELEDLLGADCEPVADMRRLFALAE
eukprot:scaffold630367_cov39-Prasinocladus_malaysianus.AAC.1